MTVLEFARRRLKESERQMSLGSEYAHDDIRYWVNYIEGAERQKEEFENMTDEIKDRLSPAIATLELMATNLVGAHLWKNLIRRLLTCQGRSMRLIQRRKRSAWFRELHQDATAPLILTDRKKEQTMPILDKKALMSDLEKRMDEYVPGKTSRTILHDLSEILDSYDVITSAPVSNASDNSVELINLYLNAKAVEGLSSKTIESYRYDLLRLHRDIGAPIKRMTVDHIRSYIASELDRGVKKNTIKNREQRYATFFKWLKNEDLIARNPMSNIATIKANPEPRFSFSGEEVQLLKEAAKNDKERAIIYFLLATGCRKGELISINRSDIDYKNLKLIVRGKGDKQRELYFDDVTAMMLQRYVSKRKDDNPALFLSKMKIRYSDSGITNLMISLSERTGIHVYAHRFRHTFAQMCLDRGMSIEEVSLLLGHTKLDVTKNYAKANQRNTENSYRKFACI